MADCKEEYKTINDIVKMDMTVGDTWYIISKRWWDQWEAYARNESSAQFPGKVSNCDILDKNELKQHIQMAKDYEVIPAKAWDVLVDKYGFDEPPPPSCSSATLTNSVAKTTKSGEGGGSAAEMFQRLVIQLPDGPQVEVHRILLNFYYFDDLGALANQNATKHSFSGVDTIDSLKKFAVATFRIKESTAKRLRLQQRLTAAKLAPLDMEDSDEQTLRDVGIFTNQDIVVDVYSPLTKSYSYDSSRDSLPPPSAAISSASNSATTPSLSSSTAVVPYTLDLLPNGGSSSRLKGTAVGGGGFSGGGGFINSYRDRDRNRIEAASGKARPGFCGLFNLGNTCFMNSAIQCISNVPILTHYFLDAATWKADLNKTNPLGMRGKLASAYANIVANVWDSEHTEMVPREFKIAVAQFAPQFSGYAQQDAQELMSFMLDGLHEDLNRIRQKPYQEMRDAEGRDDHEVAHDAWSYYTSRNDSVIVDHCYGQLKSTVVCPDCGYVSITFDPFNSLALNLPQQQIKVDLVLVPANPHLPLTRYTLVVAKSATYSELFDTLRDMLPEGVDRDHQLVGFEWFNAGASSSSSLSSSYYRFTRTVCPNDKVNTSSSSSTAFSSSGGGGGGAKDSILLVYEFDRPNVRKYMSYSGPEVIFISSKIAQEGSSTSSSSTSSNASAISSSLTLPLLMPIDSDLGKDFPACLRRICATSPLDAMKQQGHDWDLEGGAPNPLSGILTLHKIDSAFMRSNTKSGDLLAEAFANHSQSKAAAAAATANQNNTTTGASKAAGGGGGGGVTSESPSSYLMGVKKPTQHHQQSLELSIEWRNETVFREYVCGTQSGGGGAGSVKSVAMDHVAAAQQHSSVAEADRRVKVTSQGVDLQSCFELFLQKERLGKNDLWFCKKCKAEKAATKKFDLWRLPNVLILQLKRFRYGYYNRQKIDTNVTYPLTGLDLNKYVQAAHAQSNDAARNCITNGAGQSAHTQPHTRHAVHTNMHNNNYHLVAVSNHMGGLGGGHYTAYGFNAVAKQWALFDDSSVYSTPETSVVNKSAYVLVYVRDEYAHFTPFDPIIISAASNKNSLNNNNNNSIGGSEMDEDDDENENDKKQASKKTSTKGMLGKSKMDVDNNNRSSKIDMDCVD